MKANPVKTITVSFSIIFLSQTWLANAQNPPDYGFQVGYGSSVGAIVPKGDTMFVGGEFDYIGPYTGSLVSANLATGAISKTFPVVNGAIRAMIPDGSGGYFIAGNFSRVNGYRRVGLAHILSNKMLDLAWNINIEEGTGIYALLFSSTKDTLWVGGNFNSIGGTNKSKIAAIKVSTRSVLTAWGPGSFNNNWWQPNPVVSALAYFPGENPESPKLFIGGDFAGINWINKGNLAALNPTDGSLISGWRADLTAITSVGPPFQPVSPVVRSLLFRGCCATKYLYIGGVFSGLTDNTGSFTRHGLAVTNISGNGAFYSGFNANIIPQNDSGLVNCMKLVKDPGTGVTMLAIGGKFRDAGSRSVQNFTVLHTTFGTPWPIGGSYVNGRVVDTTFIPGQYASGEVMAFDTLGTEVILAGDFEGIQCSGPSVQVRRNLAQFNMSGNVIRPWFPAMQTNMPVRALAIVGNEVYTGGHFTSAGGEFRKNVAAVNVRLNTILPFNPRPDSYVNDFEFSVTKDTLYLGGNFTLIGSSQRGYTAAIDIRTNTLLPWTTTVATGGGVEDLKLDPVRNIIYAGGKFNAMGGLSRSHMAALNSKTGTVITNWTADVTTINAQITPVRSIELSTGGDTLFVGGRFNTIAGQSRRNLAAFSTTVTASPVGATANLLSWNFPVVEALPDVGVCALIVKNGRLYTGGKFSSIGAVSRNNLAAINIANVNNAVDPGWAPAITDGGGGVWCLQEKDGMLFIGGDFGRINGVTTSFAGSVTVTDGSIVAAFKPFPFVDPFGGVINAMMIHGQKMYFGGSHTNMNETYRDAVFHLNTVPEFELVSLPVRFHYFNATAVAKQLLLNGMWPVTTVSL